jgi:hypothetical protein
VVAVLAAVASVALFAQFMTGADRYGPRHSIDGGWLLAHWGGLCLAAVLAVVATAAGASWLHVARYAALDDDRLQRRLFGVALAGSAALGVAVCVGYSVLAVGYFDVPAGPLLRWSVLAAAPVAVVVAIAGLVVIVKPSLVERTWSSWFRFPVAVVVLAGVGSYLIGYDVSGSPYVVAPLHQLLQEVLPGDTDIITTTGRVGAAMLGSAVALLVARRVWWRVVTAVPLALLTAAALAPRSTGLIAAVFGAVVAGWWLWRVLAAVGGAALRVPRSQRPAAWTTAAHAAAGAQPAPGGLGERSR